MTKTEHEQLERLIAQLEDPAEVRKAYVIPNGCSREFTRGYVDGVKMQAGAIAMALRGLIGTENPAKDHVDVERIKRRGVR